MLVNTSTKVTLAQQIHQNTNYLSTRQGANKEGSEPTPSLRISTHEVKPEQKNDNKQCRTFACSAENNHGELSLQHCMSQTFTAFFPVLFITSPIP